MMEPVVERVRRLFPRAVVSVKDSGISILLDGRFCWIDSAELDPLDDLDTTYLVAALLKGLQR